MADYWKSGEKHFCKFCNCWLAGNKVSIDLHERGNHHKNMVKIKLDTIRKEKFEKERQDKKLNETLSQIERAAQESFRRDTVASATSSSSPSADIPLPSKLKRPANEPVQIQLKKPKFILKTPTPKPVFEPIAKESETTSSNDTKTTDNSNSQGTWYESKTDNQESFYWNDITGESTWTPPPVYLSIEEQRAKGLKV